MTRCWHACQSERTLMPRQVGVRRGVVERWLEICRCGAVREWWTEFDSRGLAGQWHSKWKVWHTE